MPQLITNLVKLLTYQLEGGHQGLESHDHLCRGYAKTDIYFLHAQLEICKKACNRSKLSPYLKGCPFQLDTRPSLS